MAGSQMLFACTKCHSRHPFEDLSKEEQLCKNCRRKYPLVACQYCQLEYHIIKRVDGKPVCTKCSQNISSYGMPKACKYCQIQAAFKTNYCARCISSRKRYGEPVACQSCKKKCAFNKSSESRAKVGGKVLCLQCTLEFKKQKHAHEKQLKNDDPPAQFNRNKAMSGKTNDKRPIGTNDKVIAPLKAENLAKTFKSRLDSVEVRTDSRNNSPFTNNTQKQRPSPSGNDSKPESSFGDHMSEMTKLRDEIAMLKKVISQKERVILEKDKKINQFNAERWDQEKLQRQKLGVMQKDFDTSLHKLRLENGELKKQIFTLKKKKAKYDAINAKKGSKIHLDVFKPQSPSMSHVPNSMDSPSRSKDSDNEMRTDLAMESEEKTENKNDDHESKVNDETEGIVGSKEKGIIKMDDEKDLSDDERSDNADEKEKVKDDNSDAVKDEVEIGPEKVEEDIKIVEKKDEDDENIEEENTVMKTLQPDNGTDGEEPEEETVTETKKRKLKHDSDGGSSETDDRKSKKKKKRKSKLQIDDSDEEEEESKQSSKKKIGLMFDDDSDNDTDNPEFSRKFKLHESKAQKEHREDDEDSDDELEKDPRKHIENEEEEDTRKGSDDEKSDNEQRHMKGDEEEGQIDTDDLTFAPTEPEDDDELMFSIDEDVKDDETELKNKTVTNDDVSEASSSSDDELRVDED